jgi:uncharacterized protein (DUF983 family)
MIDWIHPELAEAVHRRLCPDCGGRLHDGPRGGLAVNVECFTCGHKFNDCWPLGAHRI